MYDLHRTRGATPVAIPLVLAIAGLLACATGGGRAPSGLRDSSAPDPGTALGSEGVLAIRGEVVHPVAGPPIEDGVVLCREGKVVFVGPAAEATIPDGARTLSAAVVTPGLVDAHSVVGLAGRQEGCRAPLVGPRHPATAAERTVTYRLSVENSEHLAHFRRGLISPLFAPCSAIRSCRESDPAVGCARRCRLTPNLPGFSAPEAICGGKGEPRLLRT